MRTSLLPENRVGRVRVELIRTIPQRSAGNVSVYSQQALDSELELKGMRGHDALNRLPGVYKVAFALRKAKLIRNFGYWAENAYFVSAQRFSTAMIFPYSYGAEIIPYTFDGWPICFKDTRQFYLANRVKVAFVSARDSVQRLQASLPSVRFYWLPEAVNPDQYQCSVPLERRSLNVLELGRRYERYHRALLDGLRGKPIVHRYERLPGEIVFPTRQDLVSGFAQTQVSVCFPASMTHPQRAQGVETATYRYYESIASKCIILGHAPAELIDLFGYNPVIEADFEDPVGQLLDVLAKIESFKELVERNYSRLLEVGTLRARANTVVQVLDENGYVL